MKTIYNYISLLGLLLVLGLTSCEGFLAEYSQDEVAPKNVREYSQILYGEAYLRGEELPYSYLELLTDNVKIVSNSSNESTGTDVRVKGWGYFTWQASPEKTASGGLNIDRSWRFFYRHILASNIILKEMPNMTGDESEKAQLEGEAHAARLNAYFYLTNLYAPAYNPATAKETKGVPINDKSHGEDAQFPRATLADNYAQMIKDIEGAEKAFAQVSKPAGIFSWNLNAVTILASRVYLYMKDYPKTIEYATKALALNPVLQNLNDMDLKEGIFINKNNKEIAFSYGFFNPEYFAIGNSAYYTISDELSALYTSDDLRKANTTDGLFFRSERVNVGSFWFPKYVYYSKVTKGADESESNCYGFAIRTSEALLNRAEAYAETGQLDLAMADLNKLLANRMKKGTPALAQPATQEEVIQLVRLERRKELAFEQHRWFDLRRWDQPEIKHLYITNLESGEGNEFVLSQGDSRYTLPIPQTAFESDPSLTK